MTSRSCLRPAVYPVGSIVHVVPNQSSNQSPFFGEVIGHESRPELTYAVRRQLDGREFHFIPAERVGEVR